MTVSVWLGLFQSGDHLQAYLEACEAEDGTRWSAFGDDMGVGFVDPDRIEHGFREDPTDNVHALLAGHSHAEALAAPIAEFWSGTGGLAANAVIMVWGDELAAPRSVEGEDYALVFVATFHAAEPSP